MSLLLMVTEIFYLKEIGLDKIGILKKIKEFIKNDGIK